MICMYLAVHSSSLIFDHTDASVRDRWSFDHTDAFQFAFFNGVGYESTENDWYVHTDSSRGLCLVVYMDSASLFIWTLPRYSLYGLCLVYSLYRLIVPCTLLPR
jgi:hypothetical protein